MINPENWASQCMMGCSPDTASVLESIFILTLLVIYLEKLTTCNCS